MAVDMIAPCVETSELHRALAEAQHAIDRIARQIVDVEGSIAVLRARAASTRPASWIPCTCLKCGREFKVRACHLTKGKTSGKYCSRKCSDTRAKPSALLIDIL